MHRKDNESHQKFTTNTHHQTPPSFRSFTFRLNNLNTQIPLISIHLIVIPRFSVKFPFRSEQKMKPMVHCDKNNGHEIEYLLMLPSEQSILNENGDISSIVSSSKLSSSVLRRFIKASEVLSSFFSVSTIFGYHHFFWFFYHYNNILPNMGYPCRM